MSAKADKLIESQANLRHIGKVNSKKSNLTRLDTILSQCLKNLNLEENVRVYPIWKKWGEIMGETIASKTHPDYITGKTLVVSVTHPTWMNELQMQKRIILEKIRNLNLDFPLEDIRFRLKK